MRYLSYNLNIYKSVCTCVSACMYTVLLGRGRREGENLNKMHMSGLCVRFFFVHSDDAHEWQEWDVYTIGRREYYCCSTTAVGGAQQQRIYILYTIVIIISIFFSV